jgi:hypothetical protein
MLASQAFTSRPSRCRSPSLLRFPSSRSVWRRLYSGAAGGSFKTTLNLTAVRQRRTKTVHFGGRPWPSMD